MATQPTEGACSQCGGPMIETHPLSGYVSPHWPDGDACLRRQRRVLHAMVEDAYREGAGDGKVDEYWAADADVAKMWKASDVKRALDALKEVGGGE